MMFPAGGKFLYFFVAVLLAGVARGNAQTSMVENLRAEWEAQRRQFGNIAAAMPSEKFHYKATPEVRSFGEIIVHVADDNMAYMEAVAGVNPGGSERYSNLKTRPEILKALTDYFDYGAKVLADLTDQKAMESIPYERRGNLPRWRLVMQATGHSKEHYGNLVTYMRLNGLVPPSTAAAQQRQ